MPTNCDFPWGGVDANQIFERMMLRHPHRCSCLHCRSCWCRYIIAVTVAVTAAVTTAKIEPEGHNGNIFIRAGGVSFRPPHHTHSKKKLPSPAKLHAG